MPGYPSAPALLTITDKLAAIAPSKGNVAGYYVWLVDPDAGQSAGDPHGVPGAGIYGPSSITDAQGNWTLAVPGNSNYITFWGSRSDRWEFSGVSPYVASNPPSGGVLSGTIWVNVKDTPYGAKGDGQEISNGAMNGTNAILTCVSNPWVAADVGKQITVYGVGAAGGQLSTTILSFQTAGQITLAANSQTASASAFASWGTDDTAAIQAAINAIPLQNIVGGNIYGVSGGVVYFPPGVYFITASLTQTLGSGLILRGAGSRASIIAPTMALAGLPVIKLIDHRNAQVEFLNVRGTPAGTVASAAIQSTRHTTNSTGNTGAQLQVRSCLLGSDADVGIATGVKWTADSTALDQNNDYGLMLDVTVENFSVTAYSIGHSNSLLHRIIGGFIGFGPTAVQLFGGSFSMQDTGIAALTGPAFDFQIPVGQGSPAYFHKSSIRALGETPSTLLQAVSGAVGPLDVEFHGTDWKGSPVPKTSTIAAGSNGAILPQGSISVAANTLPAAGQVVIVTSTGNQLVTYTGGGGSATLTGCTGGTGTMTTGNAVTQATLMIDFQAPSGRVALTGCDLAAGQPGHVAQFTHASSSAELVGNLRLGFEVISYNGACRSIGNHHDPGTVTFTNVGSGNLLQMGDKGGGFTPTQIVFEDTTLSRINPGVLNLGQALTLQGATPSAQLILDTGPTANAQVVWKDNGSLKWQQYMLHADANVYLRDLVNSRMQVTYTPGASVGAALTDVNSALTSEGTLTAKGDLALGTAPRILTTGTVPTVGSGGSGTSALSIIAGSTNTAGQFQVTLTAVAPGVVAGVVAFGGGALATAPKVVLVSLAAPTAGVAAPPVVAADTYTTSGFTIRVTGPTTVTTGTYIINWIAFF